MKKTSIYIFALLITCCLVACEPSAQQKKEVESAICNCNDVFLDPEYNYFYTEDRTKPFNGECESYNQEGSIILKKNFEEGKLEGKYLEFYANGVVKNEWHFRKNRQHGDLKGFSPDGTLNYHHIYYKGDLDSVVYPKTH